MSAMLPDPLHPAVVHFPIVLTVLLPLAAVAALIAIRRGVGPVSAWGVVAVGSALLVLGSWAAVRTGEGQEEVVEEVVAENVLETHEDAGERFLLFSGLALALIAAGLLPGLAGRSARLLGTGAAVALLAAGWQVGHSGGELVYREGAASAYTVARGGSDGELSGPVPGEPETERGEAAEREEDND